MIFLDRLINSARLNDSILVSSVRPPCLGNRMPGPMFKWEVW